MNLIYLLKILDTNDIPTLVENIDLPPIDMNLAIWGAVDHGEVEVDDKKGKIAPLKECVPSCDKDLADKLYAVIKHYTDQEFNITRGRLNTTIKDPLSGRGYAWHEYLMALQWLIDTGLVIESIVTVPKTKKRPYHKFVFLGLPNNPNEEWNAKEVNKWISNFDSNKVK